MQVECWFDGAAWPNPGGRGGYGALVKVDGVLKWSTYGYIGAGPQISNNVAEYAGCIVVMRRLIQMQVSNATVYGDSNMVIRQMMRRGKAFKGLYYPYYLLAREYRARLPNIHFQWIPREHNEEADELSKRGLNDRFIRPVLTLNLSELFADVTRSEATLFKIAPEVPSTQL